MERLTIDEIIEHCDRKTGMYEKTCDVKYLETAVMGNRIKEYWEHKQVSEYLRKLKDYEDAEEQGRLIKIPLEAYCIVDFKVRKGFVLEETYHMSRKPLLVVRYDDNSLKSHSGHLGISVFLTKSEAEVKLKELRGVENGSME